MSEKTQVMQGKDLRAIAERQRVGKVLVKIGTYLFLSVIALFVLFPFYWMVISSLKTLEEYKKTVPTFWPQTVMWGNYVRAFDTANLGRLFMNTAYVGIVSTILSLIITVLSAFAFARLEFKGKNALFGALLATMMIPGELFTITNYQTVNYFGWMQSYTVLYSVRSYHLLWLYVKVQAAEGSYENLRLDNKRYSSYASIIYFRLRTGYAF